MTRFLRALIVVACLLPAAASAQRTNLKDAPPIREQLLWREGRHQIAPMLGFSVNDAYSRSLSVGLTYRYYFQQWLGLGVDFFASYVTLDTSLKGAIESELTAPGKSGTPSTASPGIIADVALTFIPISGKMMWFSRLPVAYDVQLDLGGGFVRTNATGLLTGENTFAPMWGIGTRLFFSDWIAVELGVKDYIADMVTVAPSGDRFGKSEWTQNFMFTVGVSFFLSPDLEFGE